jgi:hypothetical protein
MRRHGRMARTRLPEECRDETAAKLDAHPWRDAGSPACPLEFGLIAHVVLRFAPRREPDPDLGNALGRGHQTIC